MQYKKQKKSVKLIRIIYHDIMTIYAVLNFHSIFGSKNEKRRAYAIILSFSIQRLSVKFSAAYVVLCRDKWYGPDLQTFFAFYTAFKYEYMYNDLLNAYSGKKYIMICRKGVMVVLLPPLWGGNSTTITPFNPWPVRSSAYLPKAIYALVHICLRLNMH